MYRKERRGNCCRKNSFGNAGKIAISGFWKAVINLPKSNFTPTKKYDTIPSLTLVKSKSGYKPSSYAGCSHFL
ncbi:hypothetical protein AALA79_20270, partial [Lachnospiraceae bacterium 64-25]